jgi:hypothetical protein
MSSYVLASSQLQPEKKITVVWPSVGMIITTPQKKVQSSGGLIIMSVKKGSVIWPSVGMVGGVPRARMFWRVYNYNLKNKVQSSVAVGRNDNYNLKKKAQSSGRFINMSGKKGLSCLAVSGNVWGGSTSLDVSAGS